MAMAMPNCSGIMTAISRTVFRTAGQKYGSSTIRLTYSSVKPCSFWNACRTPWTIGQPSSRAINTMDGPISQTAGGTRRGRGGAWTGAAGVTGGDWTVITLPRTSYRVTRDRAPSRAPSAHSGWC